jgi:hypothetical protein
VFVIANNLIGAAAIKLGQGGGATGDGGEVLHQLFLLPRGTYALVALAQSLQYRLGESFAREPGESAGKALDLLVADTERHDSIIYKT